jgi:hypothetical protein
MIQNSNCVSRAQVDKNIVKLQNDPNKGKYRDSEIAEETTKTVAWIRKIIPPRRAPYVDTLLFCFAEIHNRSLSNLASEPLLLFVAWGNTLESGKINPRTDSARLFRATTPRTRCPCARHVETAAVGSLARGAVMDRKNDSSLSLL